MQLVLTHPISPHISKISSGMTSKQHASGSTPKEPALVTPNHEDSDDLHTLESKSFGEFSIDTWDDIIDHVESPSDLYSLALTSRTLYNLALPHLYKAISICSPLFIHKATINKNLIPINHLLSISQSSVDISHKTELEPSFAKRRKIEPPGAHHDRCEPPSTMAMYQKPHLLRYVRELRVEKWEAQRVVFTSDPLPRFKKGFNVYEAGEFGPEGVRDLVWKPEGCLTYYFLSETLVDLLKSMPMLEKFRYKDLHSISFIWSNWPIS